MYAILEIPLRRLDQQAVATLIPVCLGRAVTLGVGVVLVVERVARAAVQVAQAAQVAQVAGSEERVAGAVRLVGLAVPAAAVVLAAQSRRAEIPLCLTLMATA